MTWPENSPDLNTFEYWFGDDVVNFMDDNASSLKSKEIKAFLLDRLIKSRNWQENSSDLNPIKNLWGKF